MAEIENRYEFVYFFDVENGNPNGDPDAGNFPRIDPETNFGVVTDVCLKRKIRNYVEIAKGRNAPHLIYVREKAVLTLEQKNAYDSKEVQKAVKEKADPIPIARTWMCKNYFDIRAFGAVMSLKENNCGQVRGPIQISFGKSIEPIVPREITITRMAVATEKEAEAQKGDNRTMGRKNIVPYALYRAEGYISAHLAKQTGFSTDDLDLLWEALCQMFEHDHSAARGKMAARKLFVFKHGTALGNAPAHQLFSLINIERVKENGSPAREFKDYLIKVDSQNVPKGVELFEKL
ncbi:MAG: type I-C CRISPR-associated protein Cas7/Csd2 [Spirochaetales bacterium]|nr:type I-C CRISPR-associated protein Cas7/Csd2 [Spirochaetales bacterium]